jgi:hypothetical protein
MNLLKMAMRNLKRIPTDYHVSLPSDFSSSICNLNTQVRDAYATTTTNYHAYLKTPIWTQRRELYIQHFDGRCQMCKRKYKTLQLHHWHYRNLSVEEVGDLSLLCKGCHWQVEQKKKL